MIFSNIVAYKLESGQLPDCAEQLSELLAAFSFTPPLSSEAQRIGFSAPTDASQDLAVNVGDPAMVVALRTDKKTIPASAVKILLKEKIKQTEATQGFRVARKQAAELKENLLDQLLPKTLPSTSITHILLYGDVIFIGASNVKAADLAVSYLLKALQGVTFSFPFTVHLSDHMTQWLLDDHVDETLSVSDFALLEDGGGSIQWKNHDADEQDVKKYVNQGKAVTKIRLEYSPPDSQLDPITFTLNNKGIIQQIKLHKNESESASSEDKNTDPMGLFMSSAALTARVSVSLVGALEQTLGEHVM